MMISDTVFDFHLAIARDRGQLLVLQPAIFKCPQLQMSVDNLALFNFPFMGAPNSFLRTRVQYTISKNRDSSRI